MKTAVKIIKNSVFSILYKTFFLMVLWIFSVMLGYPILHEGGHAFAGLLTGAEQVSAGIFPQAYVTFRAADLSRGELWLISAAGMAAAPVFLLFFRVRSSGGRLLKMMLAAVCFAVAGLTLSITLANVCGLSLPPQLLLLAENSSLNAVGSILVSSAAAALSAFILIRLHPTATLRAYYQ